MGVALFQRIHQCGVGVGNDGHNGIPRPLGELGGDHLGSLDLLRGVGARGKGKNQRVFRQAQLCRGKRRRDRIRRGDRGGG